jgi:uncharacterized protein YutE (UPF0331/DUF86 family)
MLDDRVLGTRVARLLARVNRARARLPASRAEFEADLDAQEIVSFNLILAVQEALDVAARWIADAGSLRRTASSRKTWPATWRCAQARGT